MTISARRDARAQRRIVLATVLIANLALTAALPLLARRAPGGDATEPAVRETPAGPLVNARNLTRNETATEQFFHAVRRHRAVLYLGTSESAMHYNLGAQLNAVVSDGPRLAVLSLMGLSPIHGALLFARTERVGTETPPILYIINPVYLTRSHDGINDSWLGNVARSPVFVQMNHLGLLDSLPPDVAALYREHFASRQALRPLYAQQYAGNLLYLAAHPARRDPFDRLPPPMPSYTWDGVMPDYDEARAVHRGYVPSDALAKDRWEVQTVDESMNLKGLAAIAGVLRRQKAPALLLVLPVNRKFYAANGRDMDRFESRYRDLRAAIAAHAVPGHLFVIDLFDEPMLTLGFEDRMHQDAYGFHQLATFLRDDPDYREFLDAVELYYGAGAP